MKKGRRIYAKQKELERWRANKGLNQKEFAEKVLGVNYKWYNKIERGRQSISPEKAREICDKTGMEFEDLFQLRETQSEKEPENIITQPQSERSIQTTVLTGWKPIVDKGIGMLEKAESYWWAGGVLASWILREEIHQRYHDALSGAVNRDGEFDLRILINNTPEVLIPKEASETFLERPDPESYEVETLKKKINTILKGYKKSIGKDNIEGKIKWFPHGDIRVFISDRKQESGASTEELMLVVGTPSLGGGEESRSYLGLVIADSYTINEYKKRFETIWEKAATASLPENNSKS